LPENPPGVSTLKLDAATATGTLVKQIALVVLFG